MKLFLRFSAGLGSTALVPSGFQNSSPSKPTCGSSAALVSDSGGSFGRELQQRGVM